MDTLYSFRRCPYAIRARLALLISGFTVEIREIALRDKPADMIAASAKATVPVLVLADGTVIDESIDIMRWALGRHDPEEWLAGDDRPLIRLFDDRFKYHLDRYKYPERYDVDPQVHRKAGLALLGELDMRLMSHDNLCRQTRALADLAIMPFVRQFACVDRDWFVDQTLPRLHRWLNGHLASALFGQAMTRLPPWTPMDAPVVWSGAATG